MHLRSRGLVAVAASAIAFTGAGCTHSPSAAYTAVPVGGPTELWIDSSRHLLFAVDCDGASVDIASFENSRYTPTKERISLGGPGVGDCPADFLVPPGSKTAYLPQRDNYSGISVIDLDSKTLLAPLEFGGRHHFGRGSVSSDPNVLYVAGDELGDGDRGPHIYAINLSTKSITNYGRFEDEPGNVYAVQSIEFSPATNTVYAFINENLYSFDGGTLDVTDVIPLGVECFDSVLHQDSGVIYAKCNSQFLRIDPQDKTVTPIEKMDAADHLVIDQGRGKIYTSLYDEDRDNILQIAILDVKTDATETRIIADAPCNGSIVAFDADEQVAYFSRRSGGCTIAVPMG